MLDEVGEELPSRPSCSRIHVGTIGSGAISRIKVSFSYLWVRIDEEKPASDFRSQIEKVLSKAPFMVDLGVALVGAGPGWVETELAVVPRLRQQHGYVHAGVVTTLADHTAGAAASTRVVRGQSVLTADFTVHLLRPASGQLLRCRGEVVKAGKRLIVTQADVGRG